ncbi:hypothetical protein DFH09DRAFT_1095481 [Mycena vulgaris]|nr:hypothetical protein DFH09DRAFT_1095481 [Mycena vulgaris]
MFKVFAVVLAASALVSASSLQRNTMYARALTAAVNAIQASGRGPSNSTNTLSSQAEIPFECTSSVTDASAQLTYQPDYPWLLDLVAWTGGGPAECTIPMFSIQFTIWAVTPIGFKNVIAIGDCFGCEAVPAARNPYGLIMTYRALSASADFSDIDTGYTCVEDPSGIGCDGEWELSILVEFEAPPDSLFETGGPGCIIAGPVFTCTKTVVAGTAPKWGVTFRHINLFPVTFSVITFSLRQNAPANSRLAQAAVAGDDSRIKFHNLAYSASRMFEGVGSAGITSL